MDLEFSGEVFFWRGPSPYHFVAVPDSQAGEIADISRDVTYGWGVVPVSARLGSTKFTTSLFPKNGGYLVPLKTKVRKDEGVELGDEVTIQLTIDLGNL